jgi:dihydrodipicolinate synthase/N-acetylneuraminate lyase
MIQAVKKNRPDFVFLTGWDVVLVPMLIVGADGGTNATSGVVPELTRSLYDLTRANRIDDAMVVQNRILELFDTMLYSADFPEGFRAAVELRGFDFGKGRQPLSEPQQVDRSALKRVLECMMADFGLVGAPKFCAPRTGNIERDKVAQIAFEVMERLKERGVV